MGSKVIRYYRRFKSTMRGPSLFKTSVRNNDFVMVISGKYKGTTGKVIKKIPGTNFLIIDGIGFSRMYKNKSGEFISKYMHSKIHISNVMHYDSQSLVASRVRCSFDSDGKKCLMYTKTGNYVPSNYSPRKTGFDNTKDNDVKKDTDHVNSDSNK